MEIDAIVKLIETGMPGCKAMVSGDGRHFEAVVVSDEFEGKTPIQKQRLVMATVKTQLESDELHALSIKTYTASQWQALQG
ncbi:MAG: BolA/IbaG family iron-sulfur metabolism protein [Sedimenticola sp.]|nr:BolA/IbaG family iron-sulfur metabolism protein [Sedimenticola sp.]